MLIIKKLIYSAFLVSIVLPLASFAAYTDVTLESGVIISVSGYSLTVSGTANFDSITVNGSSLTMTMSENSTLVVTSSDKLSFDVSPTQYKKDFECGSSQSILTVFNNTSNSATVVVSPGATCTVSGGGGGGGGGGGSATPATPATPVTPATPATPVTPATPATPATTPAQPSPVAQLVSPVFNSTLRYGMTSDDVVRLQELLATDSEIYPEGIVSGWFGQLTKKAVQKFQKKYGIDAIGIVGPQTRAKLTEVFGTSEVAQPSTPSPETISVSVSAVFTVGLKKGITNGDVKRLQQLLNSDSDTQIAASGVGSSGNETNYFGSLTEKAVQKFQKKYNIASEGDSGYGYVGPKTRAKLNEVFSQ